MLPTRYYFSNAVGSVDFVPRAYVYLHWSGAPLSSVEFRALYVHARNLLKRYRLAGILADHRAMPHAPAGADREWLLSEWLPETVAQTAFVRYAALPAPNPTHRMHTTEMIQDLGRQVEVAVFEDIDQAAAWVAAAQHAQ